MLNVNAKISNLDNIFSIWRANAYLRVTYVSQGWLIVWDHRQAPPVRHDCKTTKHHDACNMAADKLEELKLRF